MSVEVLKGFKRLLPYLRLAAEQRASDLYFTVGSPVMIRIEGVARPIGKQPCTAEDIAEMADAIMSDEQRGRLREQRAVDLATYAGGIGRFRANIFYQRGDLSMVMRFVGNEILSLEALKLPPVLTELAEHRRGLVLVVGATGCGKSTTLAAMIDHRNRTTTGHILSVEDPIEFNHPHHRSVVNQREVGIDVPSYEAALVSAMREAPDVIMVGEIRTRETMQACLHLANTGHLSLSTLHANNAYQALQRIVNLYPAEMREQLFMDMSLTLRAIISQRLIRGVDGKRIAAAEVLINTPYVAELISAGRIDEIRDAMSESRDRGMQSFDHALATLVNEGKISQEEALSNADSRANLEAKMHFGG